MPIIKKNLKFSETLKQIGKINTKQAWTGPSRRHIQGSNIAKGLQNFQVLVNWDYFYGQFFLKKSLTMPKKTEREDPLEFFNIHSIAKLQKIEEGGPFVGKFIFEKNRTVPKKSKGGTFWSRPVLYVTRETFLVQFLGPTGTFWGLLNFVDLFFKGRTILVSSGGLKKNRRKAMTIVDSFLKKSAD